MSIVSLLFGLLSEFVCTFREGKGKSTFSCICFSYNYSGMMMKLFVRCDRFRSQRI